MLFSYPKYDELELLVNSFAGWMELSFEADDVLFGGHREHFRVDFTCGLSNLKDQFCVAVVKFEAIYAAFRVENSDFSGMGLRHKVVLHF